MKKNVEWIITLAAFTAMAVAAFCCIKNYKNTIYRGGEKSGVNVMSIVCFGDSLTEGIGGNGVNYPSCLKQIITSKNCDNSLKDIIVYNEGNSGESSISIASRSDGIKMITSSDINFSKLSSREQIYFATEKGEVIEPWHSSKYFTKVTIDGIKGQIRFDEKKYRYYFIRNSFVRSRRIPTGSEIVIEKNDMYKDAFPIVFIGQNGGYESIEDLISQQKAIIPQKMYDNGMYLVLGLTSGSASDRKELELAMDKEYGANYINLRQIMSGERVSDFVTAISDMDKKDMQDGIVPQCLRAKNDMVHLNSDGYQMIAQILYERMIELNMLDKLIIKGE